MAAPLPKAHLQGLLPFASTPKQEKIIKAIIEHGTIIKAAASIGMDQGNASRVVRCVEASAARRGWAPKNDLTNPVPAGFRLKGASTLYDADGNISAQWVKSETDREAQERLAQEAMEAFKDAIPRARPVKAPARQMRDDLLNLHILTDYHMGMYAWHEESGEDWDVNIAETLLMNWFAAALKDAPSARTGVLCQLGDFLHWDGLDAITPTNKHLLDADTRFQRVVRIAIRSLRGIVRMMLDKYEHVHIIMADANHDPASSAWLREVFHSFYSDEPRITVDNSADTYYRYVFGDTLLMFHHGHKRKVTNIDDVMVSKFKDDFGSTKYAYCHMGHLHHRHLLETNLMIVEQHRTMAAKDAFAAKGGWMAGRSAPVITYHSRYGEVGRVEKSPEML